MCHSSTTPTTARRGNEQETTVDAFPHFTAAAHAIDSTCDELSALGLHHLARGLADHTVTPDDARAQLEERRRVRALITGPVVVDRDPDWSERGWVSLMWVNVRHGGAQGLIRSSANTLDGDPQKFYALLTAGGEDIEFNSVQEIDDAIAALTDLRDAARELFTPQANDEQAAA